MAKIFISYAREDSSIADELTKELQQRKHEVFLDRQSIRLGSHWQEDIKRHLKNAEVFLALVTNHSDKSYYFNIEVTSVISYVAYSNKDKFILPVVLDKAALNDNGLGGFQALFGNTKELSLVVRGIEDAISRFVGFRLAQEEISALRDQTVIADSSKYVEDTIKELRDRESVGRRLAARWHFVGYTTLLVSAMFVSFLWWVAGHAIALAPIETSKLLFDAVKAITMVALLISLSRYSFMLAKSYQLDALKNADRVHAISFGRFYMKVFASQVTPAEVKEVFQHWNTAGSSNLASLNVDKIDSRLVELVSKLADRFDFRPKSSQETPLK